MRPNRRFQRIQIPTLPTPVLHRETLVNMLAQAIGPLDASQASPYKLILVCAPAGYGKTTLLVDTIQRFSIACAWCFCASSDTPLLFLQTLIASIQMRFPTFGVHLDELLSGLDGDAETQESWEKILDTLLDALHSDILQHFTLVLGDYHKVNQNASINRLVCRLLEHFPSQGVLIVESRSLPNLELAPLIARRQIFGVGSNRLRFDAQELYDLAHLQGFTDFSLKEADYLTGAFEGWIAGMLLGSGLGYTQMNPVIPSHQQRWEGHLLLADRQQLSRYITFEIFFQEMAIYEFLKTTSIFDWLVPEYCDELLGVSNSLERLVYAEQQGLLVMRSEKPVSQAKSGVYICHPILRELLVENLQQQAPEQYLELRKQAAHILQKHQEYEQAMMHALLAQEYSLAIGIMMPIVSDLIDRGEEEKVARWLALLPAQMVAHDPQLVLLQAKLYLTRNEYTKVPPLLDTVEKLLAALSPEQDHAQYTRLQAEARLAHSKLLFYQGEFQSAQELCQQALALLPVEEHHLRMRVYHRLGVCFIVGKGQIHEGIIQIQQALQLSGLLQNEWQTATLNRLLASAYSWIGSYTLADYYQARALQTWEKLNEPRGITNNLTSMGLLKLRQGFTQQAEEILLKALHMAREVYHFTSGEAYALVALGELYCALTHYMQALTCLEDGLRLAHQCKDHYLIHCGLCSLATTYLFMGELQTSLFFLNQVQFKEKEGQNYEVILYYLTSGRIFLAREMYDAARNDLEKASGLARQTGIRFFYLRALVLLAVCALRQQKRKEAGQHVEQVMSMNKEGNFTYDLQMEFDRYPELQEIMDQGKREQDRDVSSVVLPSLNETAPFKRLNILAFGDPQLLIDGVPVTRWHLTRSLELFFLLLEKNHPMQKEQLIDALWPEATIDQIDTTMRTAIYYLRQAIGKNCILYHSGLYSLNLSTKYGTHIEYDVDLFEQNYTKARKAQADQDEETASKAFIRMIELYRGDYLRSFYNDWCISRRDRLRRAYMDAHQQLALLAGYRERWDECLQHWHNLLALDACSEDAHYGIMNCYLQLGQRNLALKQYQLCCQHLQDELQTTPGPLIQQLYQRVLHLPSSGHLSSQNL